MHNWEAVSGKSRDQKPSGTHVVTTPLKAPASKVGPALPSLLFSDITCVTRSLMAPKLAKRIAELVPCLQSTGAKPLHKPSGPCAFTTCPATASVLLLRAPAAAMSIDCVLMTSAGVTTSMDSATPAERPAKTFTKTLFGARNRSSIFLLLSKLKNRIPPFKVFEAISAGDPA